MGFLGLDLLAIRHLSRQLDIQANEVAAAAKELTALIETTEWFGADQAAFVNEWQSAHLPALRRSTDLLREASAHAQQGASAQERASREG